MFIVFGWVQLDISIFPDKIFAAILARVLLIFVRAFHLIGRRINVKYKGNIPIA